MSCAKSQPPAVVTFRPDFCSPAYLNGLLRLQNLHWLEIRRRAGTDGAVSTFQFVIPASLSNLVCVLGTEVPRLEGELGCRVRQIPAPDFVDPDGLRVFSVDYAEAPTTVPAAQAHPRFLAALRAICVRLQLTNICVDTAVYHLRGGDGGGGGRGCAACAKVRTHTKSVRRTSAARPRLRPPAPPLLLDLARPRTRRPASAEAAAAAVTVAAAVVGDDASKKAAAAETAEEKMAEIAVNSLSRRLPIAEAAIDAAALVATAASEALRVCSGGDCRRRPHWRQFGLDYCIAFVVADDVVARLRLCDDVVGVFADWSTDLAGLLLTGCARLAADGVATAAFAASRIADDAAGHLLCGLAAELAAEMTEAERLMVRVSLPCDWRTSRSLLAIQPLRRRCSSCGTIITAEPIGATSYRLTVKSRGRRCSKQASLLQLADCARSSKDANLGGLLLQEVAALPSNSGR